MSLFLLAWQKGRIATGLRQCLNTGHRGPQPLVLDVWVTGLSRQMDYHETKWLPQG